MSSDTVTMAGSALVSAVVGLFEGYGGLTMAVREVLDAQLVAYSEIDPAACRVLAHHHPGIPNLGDITEIDWPRLRLDRSQPLILTGGFPCQDVSHRGKRAGMHPDTQSGLWTHMAYAIDQLQPEMVIIENVRGLLNADAHCDLEPCPWCVGNTGARPLRALGAVLGDLAELGYDAKWASLRAADIGAPHERTRVFILATPADADRLGPIRARRARPRRPRPTYDHLPALPEWGHYAPAIRRWEDVLGRPAPAPTTTSRTGGQQLSARLVEWMMGLPDGYVTSPVLRLTRAEQLRLLGNGVVPQQAARAIEQLLDLATAHQLQEAS